MKKTHTPARRVITRRAVNPNGRFPSFKMGRAIDFESLLERDFLHLAEFDRQVVAIWEQPMTVEVEIKRKRKKRTPDFLLLMRDGSLLVHEVKPESKAALRRNQETFAALEPVLAGQGYQYVVSLDTDIRQEPRLTNIKYFFRYKRTPVTEVDRLWLHQILGERGSASIAELASGALGRVIIKECLFALIYLGHLDVEIDQPFTDDSLVSQGAFPATRYVEHKEVVVS